MYFFSEQKQQAEITLSHYFTYTRKMLLYVILGVILVKSANVQAQYCVTPLSEYGACVILTQCPYVVELYGVNNGNAQALQYLLGAQRSCGTHSVNGNPVVCCAKPVVYGQTMVQSTQSPPTEQPVTPTLSTTSRRPRPPRPVRPVTPSSVTEPNWPPIQQVQTGEKCTDPNGIDGVCKGVRRCRFILNEYSLKKGEQSYIKYLQRSNEICSFEPTNVCCPSRHSH